MGALLFKKPVYRSVIGGFLRFLPFFYAWVGARARVNLSFYVKLNILICKNSWTKSRPYDIIIVAATHKTLIIKK